MTSVAVISPFSSLTAFIISTSEVSLTSNVSLSAYVGMGMDGMDGSAGNESSAQTGLSLKLLILCCRLQAPRRVPTASSKTFLFIVVPNVALLLSEGRLYRFVSVHYDDFVGKHFVKALVYAISTFKFLASHAPVYVY